MFIVLSDSIKSKLYPLQLCADCEGNLFQTWITRTAKSVPEYFFWNLGSITFRVSSCGIAGFKSKKTQ